MTDKSNELTKLIAVPDDPQAALIVGALADNGIEATATGGATAGFRAEAPGLVHVVVKQTDLARAREVLEKIKLGSIEIDWSQVDVGEPEGE